MNGDGDELAYRNHVHRMRPRVAKTGNHETITKTQQSPDCDDNSVRNMQLAVVESTPSRIRAPRTTPDKPFECYLCGDGFRCLRELEMHQSQRNTKNACPRCEYCACSAKDLDGHLRMHAVHKCAECNSVFESDDAMQTHYEQIHDVDEQMEETINQDIEHGSRSHRELVEMVIARQQHHQSTRLSVAPAHRRQFASQQHHRRSVANEYVGRLRPSSPPTVPVVHTAFSMEIARRRELEAIHIEELLRNNEVIDDEMDTYRSDREHSHRVYVGRTVPKLFDMRLRKSHPQQQTHHVTAEDEVLLRRIENANAQSSHTQHKDKEGEPPNELVNGGGRQRRLIEQHERVIDEHGNEMMQVTYYEMINNNDSIDNNDDDDLPIVVDDNEEHEIDYSTAHVTSGGTAFITQGDQMKIEPLPEFLPPQLSYPCTYCDKVFKFAWHYRRHVEKAHIATAVPMCDDCGRTFKTMKLLNQHSRVHTNVQPFACRWCGITFKWGSSKQRHELLHMEQVVQQALVGDEQSVSDQQFAEAPPAINDKQEQQVECVAAEVEHDRVW